MTNILLLCGGGSSEHEISLISADFIETTLNKNVNFTVKRLILQKNGDFVDKQGAIFQFSKQAVSSKNDTFAVDFVVPCIHGYPGETGDIQSFLEIYNMPYLGSKSAASQICFNKVTTKLWFDALSIPNTPFAFITILDDNSVKLVQDKLKDWDSVFIKAAEQGSSVGCYKLDKDASVDEIFATLTDAFTYSKFVLIEKTIVARELEVAFYEHNNQIVITDPGEIICPTNSFYSFDEKYSSKSHTQTKVKASVSDEICKKIKDYALIAVTNLKLRHLSRIDFFLTEDNQIYLNEINTFPGMTPISMFPKMLENNGQTLADFLNSVIINHLNDQG